MKSSPLKAILAAYDPRKPLEKASTIPAPWYTDEALYRLERERVFGRTWQFAGRLDQLASPGDFVTCEIAGEPVVVARGADRKIRAFFNVCRHHAAAVATQACGNASVFRCPYHGWTYALDGALKGAPEFEGVCEFDKSRMGLVRLRAETWENFVFVNLSPKGPGLLESLGTVPGKVAPLKLDALRFFERRTYTLRCNWKVYVDNYLDGGYHVPHLHKGLSGVLDYSQYKIEAYDKACLQTSPLKPNPDDPGTSSVRKGDRADYWWFWPNFMLNWYEGMMDVNIVFPLAVEKTLVVFDFYFADGAPSDAENNRRSLAVGERVQQEDIAVCEAVQKGLGSRAYIAGRLSVRREAGEHLFHRLLAQNLGSKRG